MPRRDLTKTIRFERSAYIGFMKQLILILAGLFIVVSAFGADGPCVVPQRGYFRIHVGTSGLFGAFAHDHSIEAQKITGCASVDSKDPAHSSIKLTFSTADIRVMDPKASARDRAEVQKNMETDVLRVQEYAVVVFESTSIEPAGSNQFRARGNLTIRGRTQAVAVPVTFRRMDDGTYEATGKYTIKQSAFGIKPIQLGGGTIKVKDEVETDFDLFLK